MLAGEQAPLRTVNLAAPASPIRRRPPGTRHAHLCQRCHFPAAPAVHVAVDLSRGGITGSCSAGQWPCAHAQMGGALSQRCSTALIVPCPLRRHDSDQLGSSGWHAFTICRSISRCSRRVATVQHGRRYRRVGDGHRPAELKGRRRKIEKQLGPCGDGLATTKAGYRDGAQRSLDQAEAEPIRS